MLVTLGTIKVIYNKVDRFTNELHSTTIGTVGLPRLAREVT